MADPEMAEAVHVSHTMGVDISTHTNRLYDVCTVCHECSCHSPSALLMPCDDITWLFRPTD